MVKVSVILLTYNHEAYIRQALESILAQKVSFTIEVIVLEDCSTDSTRNIILEYKSRFEKRFESLRYFFCKRNHGGHYTWRAGRRHARGQYYAPLEGDDYWTDSSKLQKQVDILDSSPDLIGCAHNTEVIRDGGSRKELLVPVDQKSTVVNLKDLISGRAYYHTSSFLWRNIYSNGEPKAHFYHSSLMGDYFLSMLHAQHGDIKYIDEVMSCYRMTGEGTWSKYSERERSQINLRCLFMYNKVLKYKYTHEFSRLWWGCDAEMQSLGFKKGNKFSYFKLWLLRCSIDVRSNEYTRLWAEKLAEKRTLSKSRFVTGAFEIVERFLMQQTNISRNSRQLDETRGYIAHRSPIDKTIRILCQALWHSFYLWDINRYFMYYKLHVYDYFNIKMYKQSDK